MGRYPPQVPEKDTCAAADIQLGQQRSHSCVFATMRKSMHATAPQPSAAATSHALSSSAMLAEAVHPTAADAAV